MKRYETVQQLDAHSLFVMFEIYLASNGYYITTPRTPLSSEMAEFYDCDYRRMGIRVCYDRIEVGLILDDTFIDVFAILNIPCEMRGNTLLLGCPSARQGYRKLKLSCGVAAAKERVRSFILKRSNPNSR